MDENPDECSNEDVCTMLDVLDVLFETDEHSLPFAHTIDAYCSENKKMKESLEEDERLAEKAFIINPRL